MHSVFELIDLVEQNLSAYRDGSVPLRGLVGELDAILVEIEKRDESLSTQLRQDWHELEDINALHLTKEEEDNKRCSLSEEDLRDVSKSIDAMRWKIHSAKGIGTGKGDGSGCWR